MGPVTEASWARISGRDESADTGVSSGVPCYSRDRMGGGKVCKMAPKGREYSSSERLSYLSEVTLSKTLAGLDY